MATATEAGGADPQEPTIEVINRKTKGGKDLQYRLTVLQQPERARACGSGSKSAADRRPVDPPPVVELRIYEHGPNQDPKDITFNYNANFFLFATLELARPIAHGRVQTPGATGTPVLTGMPVSGMAYLDRPAEAGYFLFPDLSVRHEGLYKLSFNLYEETKEERDTDEEVSSPKQSPMGASFDWRMEVKSKPFSVFSAKKFPGLAESTTLSRTVAEQGCRVRIRRDVRMRRRDGKGEYKKVDDDFGHRPTGRTPERQMHPHPDYRQRSASAASDHSRAAYPVDPQRRPSMADQYAPAPPPPGFSQNAGGQHLGFGAPASRGPQSYHGAQPPPMSPVAGFPSSTHPSPFQAPSQPYGYSSRPSSQYEPTRGGLDERRHSNAAYAPSSSYSAASNGDVKLEVDTKDRRFSQGHSSFPPMLLPSPACSEAKPESATKVSDLRTILNPTPDGSSSTLNGRGVDSTTPIAVDTNPGPLENPDAGFQTGSKRPHAGPLYPEQLRNGARPGDANERNGGRDYRDCGNNRFYPGLPLTGRDGDEKLMPENRFYTG